VVGRAVEAERPPALRRRHGRREQRVARRRADPLPHPVDEPHGEHLPRRPGQRDERPRHRREAVSRHDERLAARHAVRPPAAGQLEQRRRGLGRPLDRAERGRAGAEGRREEDRQQRVDHLARQVGQQADQRERPHGAAERRAACRDRPGRGVEHAAGAECARPAARSSAGRP
jgi:hypothetical protein